MSLFGSDATTALSIGPLVLSATLLKNFLRPPKSGEPLDAGFARTGYSVFITASLESPWPSS